jgi:hypothetical protein
MKPNMTAEEFAAHLSALYPNKTFEVMDKDGAGCEDHPNASPLVVCLMTDEMCIVDPLSSSCSRFSVDPQATYGIKPQDAADIRAFNKVEIA